jgi:citrate lyase subunit beta / citryl-CoA lyase
LWYRSWMFVPGNHPRRLTKAKELSADVIIYDLEDAVPPDEKERARRLVREALRHSPDRVQFVRVNDPSTPYFVDDLAEVTGAGLSGIVLPKAAGRDSVLFADSLLSRFEERSGVPKGSTEIVPLVETAAGLYRAYEIASAGSRIRRMAFGSIDFALDIGAQLTKEGTEVLYARSRLVVVSRAAGIEPPIDAVFADIRDSDGLLQEARLAKQLGFRGKMVIHPSQIDVVNRVFSPTPQEVEEAKKIARAFSEALETGSAAIRVDGKMVDLPVARRAKRILEQAKALGLI